MGESKERTGRKKKLEKAKSITVNVIICELFLRSLSVNVYLLGVYQKTLKERRKKERKKKALHL